MTRMARRRLDLKGEGHLVVGTAAGRRERREEDRGGRRRDLRGRPLGRKVVRECEGIRGTVLVWIHLEKVLAVRAQRTCVVGRHKLGVQRKQTCSKRRG